MLSFFSGNDQCAGTATAQTLIDLSSGTVSGNSVTVDATSFAQTLGPGSYSFLASYNGNSTFMPSTAACEPLTVALPELLHATITTQILDGSGHDITGTTKTIYYVTVHDRATVTGSGPVPTGTVTFDKIQPRLTTEIHFPDYSIVAGNPATGTIVHDTGIVSAPAGNVAVLPVPAGSVSFTFFTGGDCTSGAPHGAGAVMIGGWSSGVGTGGTGIAHGSTPEGPLAAGFYAFNASYAGDAIYKPVQSACEPFQVQPPQCPEDPKRAALMTRTVDPTGASHGVANYLTLQAAYDAAQWSARERDDRDVRQYDRERDPRR
jgi:hypothetical protein